MSECGVLVVVPSLSRSLFRPAVFGFLVTMVLRRSFARVLKHFEIFPGGNIL